jgi:hypothetical protein
MVRPCRHCRTPLATVLPWRRLAVAFAALAIAGPQTAAGMNGATALEADPRLSRQPSWTIPDAADVRRTAMEWLVGRRGGDAPGSAEVEERVRAAWEAALVPGSGGDPLDAVMTTIAAGEPRAAAVREAVGAGARPEADWLDEPTTPAFVRDAVKLWLGRELVRGDRFDEALPLLADLDVATAVDPATLLFHRAACQHWLLDTAGAIDSLDALLEREAEIPVRYGRVARLLRADVEKLREDSLDHIARRMRDLTRRLDQGRAGPATRRVQEGVVESLDKLIERIEQQQQQHQAASGGAGGAGEGQGSVGKPQEDSRPAGGRGPGDVQHRDLGSGEGWGNLPPHERERVLQQIGREFPPHYREAIEHYFKRLAAGEEGR